MTGHFRSYQITDVEEPKTKPDHWKITFTNEHNPDVMITVDVPKRGVFENLDDVVDQPLAERLADMIASVIRNTLTSPDAAQR